MKKIVFPFLFLFAIILSESKISAQTLYTDSVIGYSMNIPDDWTYKTFEKSETVISCSSTNALANYSVSIKKLADGVTAKQHLEYLESFMPAAGYSENFMPAESRDIKGEEAAAYNADEVYGGAYTVTKKDILIVQMIFVYRNGPYAYLTIQTCPQENLDEFMPLFNIFHNSFKLIK